MKNKLAYLLVVAAVAAISVAAASAQPKTNKESSATKSADDEKRRAQVVATFSGGRITVGEVEDAINQKNPFMRQRYLNAKQLEPLLDEMIRNELLAGEAERRGFDKKIEVAHAVKQHAVQTLLKEEFDDKISEESIAAQEVKKYYDDNIEQFVRPAKCRVNYILLSTREDAMKLLPEAKTADLRAFRDLARKHSVDEQTKLRGGDLRYFDKKGVSSDAGQTTVDPAIVKAAFALKDEGDVTPRPIKVKGGFAIIRLSGKREADSRSLKDAEQQIRKQLWREQRKKHMDDFVAQLKEKYKPESHPELMDAIKMDAGPPGSGIRPGFPAGPRPGSKQAAPRPGR
ncbi:MAG: peptidyl-prolyl cis-trans isomerase [Deltaproteobacteria bacterium]|nr:peptidyl-prolyl cis-trans isomerase [Deltaproteobacteria bacterium]